MLGAILGYGGYSQQKEEDTYPEYYQRLNEIKVSIVPVNNNYGVFSKKYRYLIIVLVTPHLKMVEI